MSDIIIEEHGTIDKYEGDAIIALVGAPLPMEDHALRAVRAALKIKIHEKIINKNIKKIAGKAKTESMDKDLYDAMETLTHNQIEIFTRIGINSGEMIAGYMGSEKKKNYTIMGNNVNLAARLEGLNKLYSTFGIIISESTKLMCEDKILCRKLDKVQVVNVNTPVQLYEPLAEKNKANDKILKYAALWDEAIDELYQEEYQAAYEKFKKLYAASPLDKTAKYYLNLLENFFLQGKVPLENDNAGVVYNSELKCFKILNK
jgi:adenylate cyclase